FAAEERACSLRVPRAALVGADPSGAGFEQCGPHGIERLARDEHDQLPVHARDLYTGSSAPSTARTVSSSSSTPAAAALSRICSGREEPTIALATLGSRRIQASASCAVVIPRPSAIGPSR